MKITCSCGKMLPIPDHLAGKRVRCPYCQAKMTVPGGPEDLPVALDRKPTPEELLNRATGPEKDDHDPLAALGDLAAAIDDAPGAEPATAQPITADDVAPPPPTDDMGDLMAALEAGVPASKPTVAAKPVTVARKAKAAKANGTKQTQADDSDDEPAAKKRDLMPIILIGSAGLVLLLTVVGLIVLRGGDSKKPKPETVSPEMVLPEDDGYRGGNDSNGFFPGIPGGRTSKDYEREHGKKALNKR